MKRTNLVLNEKLLDEATRVLAAKTYSATVNTALLRVRKILRLPTFFGRGRWQGDLQAMPEDRDGPARGSDYKSRGKEKNDPTRYFHADRTIEA